MIHKRIRQRDFVIDVYGPIFLGEYGFTIAMELDGVLSKELFNSITNKVDTLKTLKIAQEMASFAGTQLYKIATSEFKGPTEYFQQLQQLSESINKKLKTAK